MRFEELLDRHERGRLTQTGAAEIVASWRCSGWSLTGAAGCASLGDAADRAPPGLHRAAAPRAPVSRCRSTAICARHWRGAGCWARGWACRPGRRARRRSRWRTIRPMSSGCSPARWRADEVRRIGLPETEAVLRRVRLSAAGTRWRAGWRWSTGWPATRPAARTMPGRTMARAIASSTTSPWRCATSWRRAWQGRCWWSTPTCTRATARRASSRRPPRLHLLDPRREELSGPQGTLGHRYRAARPRRRRDLSGGAAQRAGRRRWTAARPALVFYNAGVDVHGADRLGRLALTDAGIRARDATVIAAVRGRGVPLVGVLGGGYSDDPLALAERHAILFEEAAKAA